MKYFFIFLIVILAIIAGFNLQEYATPEKFDFIKPEYLNWIKFSAVGFYLMVGLLGVLLLFGFTISYSESKKQKDVTSLKDLQINNLQGVAEVYEEQISELKKVKEASKNEASTLRKEVAELKSDPDRIKAAVSELEKSTSKGVQENSNMISTMKKAAEDDRSFLESMKKSNHETATLVKALSSTVLAIPGLSDLVDIDVNSLNATNSSKTMIFPDKQEEIIDARVTIKCINDMCEDGDLSGEEDELVEFLMEQQEKLGAYNRDFLLIAWAIGYILENMCEEAEELGQELKDTIEKLVPELK